MFKVYFFLLVVTFDCREYVAGETLTYACLDSTLGVDAGPSNKIEYNCKHDRAYVLGDYDVPKEDDLWPICQSRTTTVVPGKMRNRFIFIIIFLEMLSFFMFFYF